MYIYWFDVFIIFLGEWKIIVMNYVIYLFSYLIVMGKNGVWKSDDFKIKIFCVKI